jgi:hypothetical protein
MIHTIVVYTIEFRYKISIISCKIHRYDVLYIIQYAVRASEVSSTITCKIGFLMTGSRPPSRLYYGENSLKPQSNFLDHLYGGVRNL